MKYLQAYKDSTGFHFVVDLGGGVSKHFNYGPVPGVVHQLNAETQVSEPVEELEADYVKRIQAEIETTCKQIAAGETKTHLGLAGQEF